MDTITNIATDPRWYSISIMASAFAGCALVTAMQPSSWTIETRSRLTSTFHAFVSTGFAIYALWDLMQHERGAGSRLFPYPIFSSATEGDAPKVVHEPDDIWYYTTESSLLGSCITLGYIIFDTVLGAAFPHLLDKAMWIHHSIVILSYGMGIFSNFSVNYLTLLLINEASTPFVNIFFITKNDWKDWRKPVNGFLMWLSYLVCRLGINMTLAFSMHQTITQRAFEEHPIIIIVHIITFTAAQILNVNWFYRISLGLFKEVVKIVCPSRTKPSGESSKVANVGYHLVKATQEDPAAPGIPTKVTVQAGAESPQLIHARKRKA